jgi:predicted RNA-binding Zn-ribbon protein involved in translation (DUF1610 family)
MTVSCSACGQEWPRDPALELKCPTCNARPGTYCSQPRPSGHRVRFGGTLIHPGRDQLAMDMGLLQRCQAAQPRPHPDALPLFASCQPPAPLLKQSPNNGDSP